MSLLQPGLPDHRLSVADLPTPREWGRPILEGVVWAVLATALYTAFAQGNFYKTDGPYLVLNLVNGVCSHPYNVLYMPALFALHGLGAALGWSAYGTGLLLSALGMGLGIGVAHVVFGRLGMSAGRSHLASLLLATAPGVFFFGTVVEHHGLFLPFAGFAFLGAIEMARRPTWWMAVLVAVLTHIGYMAHSTGNLLPGIVLVYFCAMRWDLGTRRRDLGLAFFSFGLHLVMFYGLRYVELPGEGAAAALDAVFVSGTGTPRGIHYLPEIVWKEWLGPFLPISVLSLWALRRPELKREAQAAVTGLIPYIGTGMLVLVDEPEFGAYQLPLVIPAARLTAALLTPRWSIVAAAVGTVLSIVAIERHRDVAPQREWAAGLRAATGGGDYVLLFGGTAEICYMLTEAPDSPHFVPYAAAAGVSDGDVAGLITVFDHYVKAQADDGRQVWFTDGATDELRRLEAADDRTTGRAAARALLEHIAARYRPERSPDPRFPAVRLRTGQ